MTKTEKILLVSSLILLLAAAGVFFYKKGSGLSSGDMLSINLTPFQTPRGWGYDIKVGKDFGIHQDRIPAIAVNEMFASKEDALKVGGLVVEKMKHKKPPHGYRTGA